MHDNRVEARGLIGRPLRRVEDPRLLRGEGAFVDDLRFEGTLHAAFVRSPFAHAGVGHIDAEAARAAAGVLAVLTAADLPEIDRSLPAGMPLPDGTAAHTQHPLADDVVRYPGEIVAVVVADDRYAAEDAAELVTVAWEPRPATVEPPAALAGETAPVWPDRPGGVACRFGRGYGDTAAAFGGFETVVVRERFTIERSAGVPLEPRAALAVPGEPLTLYTSTQAPARVQATVAGLLGLPVGQVRVVAPDVGGGFGVKGRAYPEEIIVAALARRLERPVKWAGTRREDMLTTGQGRGLTIDAELAANPDGTLRGVRLRAVLDAGAYLPVGVSALSHLAQHAIGPYRLPALESDLVAVYTHKVPWQPVRGNGRPEGIYVLERLLDRLAARLDLDPAEVRRRNLLPADAFPYDTGLPSGPHQTVVYDSGDYPALLDQTLALAGYEALRREQSERRARGELMGIGLACVIESTGVGPEGARVTLGPDGEAEITLSSSGQGQGHATVFRQVVADALGLPLARIRFRQGDTEPGVEGMGTFASRLAMAAGNAVHLAAEALRQQAREIAAGALEVALADLEVVGERVQVRGVPARGFSLTELAVLALRRGAPDGLRGDGRFDVERPISFAGGVHLAVVDLDRDTGVARLRRYVTAHDCGTVLNPLLVEGQVQGGVAHGLGNVLLEASVVELASGQVLTGSLIDYAVPAARDVPGVESAHAETPSPFNPLGIKGAGEGGTIGAFPAIANAIEDALRPLGGRLTALPATAERLLRAIRGGE